MMTPSPTPVEAFLLALTALPAQARALSVPATEDALRLAWGRLAPGVNPLDPRASRRAMEIMAGRLAHTARLVEMELAPLLSAIAARLVRLERGTSAICIHDFGPRGITFLTLHGHTPARMVAGLVDGLPAEHWLRAALAEAEQIITPKGQRAILLGPLAPDEISEDHYDTHRALLWTRGYAAWQREQEQALERDRRAREAEDRRRQEALRSPEWLAGRVAALEAQLRIMEMKSDTSV